MGNEASIVLKVLDKASGPMRQIARNFQTMNKVNREALETTAKTAAGLGAGLAATSAAGIVMAGKQSADLEGALGEVASVGVGNLGLLRDAALDFTNQFAGTAAPDFVRAAYDVKSGISSLSDEGVAEYAKLAGLTAKATKATTGEMTSLFATGFGIYREQFEHLSDIEFGKVFSGGIAASVQAFKTTGPQMQAGIENLGATATKALVPMQEQFAVLGTLQQTMSGSEAGTKYRAVLQGIAKAGGELGLPFLDANRKIKSMPEVLDLLRKKYGETLDAVEGEEIKKAFGSEEAVGVINLLYGQVDKLRESTKGLGETMKNGTAITEEMARKMNEGLGPEATRTGQRLANLGAVVGQALTPVLVPLLRMVGDAVVKFQGWAKENPTLARTIMLAGVALGGVVAVLGTLVAAMTALNFAVLANPITWVVAGIVVALAGLAAAGVWIVANWEKVKGWWNAFWGEYGNAVLVTMGVITGPLGWLAAAAGLIINNWEGLKAFFTNLWGDVAAAWDAGSWVDAGAALIQGLWDGMNALLGQVINWLGDKVAGLFDWLPDSIKAQLGITTGSAGTPAGGSAGGGPGPTPAAAAPITAAQAVGQPQRNRLDGRVVIDVNGPPGTRIRSAEQTGDAGVDLSTGLTVGLTG